MQYEDLKREAVGDLCGKGWTEMEISLVLRISLTNVIRFRAETER